MDNKKSKDVWSRRALAGIEGIKRKTKTFFERYVTVEGTADEIKQEAKYRLNYASLGVALGLLAFFLARGTFPFSVRPMGAALMCAATAYTPFIYVGLVIASIFENNTLIYFVTYTVGFVLRFAGSYLFSKNKQELFYYDGIVIKALCATVMMFVCGAGSCVAGGFLYYDLFGALLGIVCAPVLVYLYSGVFDKKARFTALHDAGTAALMASLVFALRDMQLFGFSLGAVAAFGLSLYISKECGMLRGGIIGLICGLAYNMLYAPLFAISALVSGLFWKTGTVAASIAALLGGVFYGVYAGGFGTLRTLAPDLLCATLIFTPLANMELLPLPTLYRGGTSAGIAQAKETVASQSLRGTNLKLKNISDAMTTLAGIFHKLSNAEKKPELKRTAQRCRDCFFEHCNKCASYDICWDDKYPESEATLRDIAIEVYEGALATKASLAATPFEDCPCIDDILKDINNAYAKELSEALEGNKAEIFAVDYNAMSALLNEAINENAREYEIDEALTSRLKNAARYLNFTSHTLCVYGKRRKKIIASGVDLARVKLGVEEIRRSFERVIGAPLTGPAFSVEGGNVTMSLAASPLYKCEFFSRSAKKPGEDINGDSVTHFKNNEEYFYTVLSDGMGSGRDAALASRLTAVYLEKMLACGNNKSQTLSMLNSFISQKSKECFATVDLLEVDLLTGKASFIKSGAAASYILRGSSLFKIASQTMPIGIVRELNAEEVTFELLDNDIIVMVSDGVSACFEDGVWLTELLTEGWRRKDTPDDICLRILDAAAEHNGRRDDMSVAMIKVSKT